MVFSGTGIAGRRRQWHPTPVLLPGKSHGWRGLVGYSPWGRQELDTISLLLSYMWVHVQLCPTLCDPMDCSLPGSSVFMEFSRQECWSELPFPSPGDLPDPGIKLVFLMSLALAGRFTTEPPGKPSSTTYYNYFLSKTFSWCFNIKLSKINRMKRQKSQRISRPEKHYEPIQHNLYSVHTVTG